MTDAKRHSIAVLTSDSLPLPGGVAVYLDQLCRALAPQALLLSTVSGSESSAAAYEVRRLASAPERKLRSLRGDGFAPWRKLNTLLYWRRVARQYGRPLEELLRENGVERLVIGYWSPEAHFWKETARRMGLPVWAVAYGFELLRPLSSRPATWRSLDWKSFETIISISQGTSHLLGRLYGIAEDRIKLLRPALDTDRLPQEAPCSPGRGDGWPTLLSLGRLVPRKGFDMALEAFKLVLSEFPGARLVIAGDGPERDDLHCLAERLGIKGSVTFTGSVSEADKWQLYSQADIFLLCNRTLEQTDFEGFGIVFLEAAWFGLPVVAGNNGGVAAAVLDGITGMLVDADDVHSIAEAVKLLLRDPGLRSKMGVKARSRVMEEFSLPHFQARARSLFGISSQGDPPT